MNLLAKLRFLKSRKIHDIFHEFPNSLNGYFGGLIDCCCVEKREKEKK
jgi:hypothetical protein